MGNISKIFGKFKLPNLGWRPKKNSYNLPFTIELKENFHIHWQDVRMEMDADTLSCLWVALDDAWNSWDDDDRPENLKDMKRYGWWPDEEGRDFYKDRNKEDGHNFKTFPRTEGGKQYYDNAIQLEKQKGGQYHLHWKNFRMEFGKKTLLALKEMFDNACS